MRASSVDFVTSFFTGMEVLLKVLYFLKLIKRALSIKVFFVFSCLHRSKLQTNFLKYLNSNIDLSIEFVTISETKVNIIQQILVAGAVENNVETLLVMLDGLCIVFG